MYISSQLWQLFGSTQKIKFPRKPKPGLTSLGPGNLALRKKDSRKVSPRRRTFFHVSRLAAEILVRQSPLHKSPRGGVGNSTQSPESRRSHEQLFYEKSKPSEGNNKKKETGGSLQQRRVSCWLGNHHFGLGLAAKLLSAVCNLNVQSYTKS